MGWSVWSSKNGTRPGCSTAREPGENSTVSPHQLSCTTVSHGTAKPSTLTGPSWLPGSAAAARKPVSRATAMNDGSTMASVALLAGRGRGRGTSSSGHDVETFSGADFVGNEPRLGAV